ncbi:hypothetical protein E5E91_13170 [Deinococcus radiodurans R1 = ATCC 13939 = DSM 20539]|uniref:Uncharacterized protein n=1 Tax=Deinococcus radiodurans (strain ATCC 13939 / DSM 20539 / JCM 16871 / CCUG 27074 / LMG 4051 / NBRC 15346 / NCIMB 9279 / VKM B-1422 / R1) TaxID=243230 RepID=Q9RRE8_DEIRA|nr:hypothetical protein DR_2544 [Deinococcus radiodurans R1 = ATCC 13939 = DSM 20539]QEM71901.1 hypothetical protein DXG80_09100 [Deinococcus radiodurans]UDL01543.1 hypothetical protein E5E91_13170 [Deinococcus radiodurans R1 = ATCC 13939 = DSM 20539]HCE65024.1 hypothetical protein [Deinococcus radiodurans]
MRRSRLVSFLLLAAAVVGATLKVVKDDRSAVRLPPAVYVPPSGPLIEPKENAGRCLATAKITLPKSYNAFANHWRFTEAKQLTAETWQIRGELSEYSATGVKVFIFQCVDSNEATGVELHPK